MTTTGTIITNGYANDAVLVYPSVQSGPNESTTILISLSATAAVVTVPETWKRRWVRVLASVNCSILFGSSASMTAVSNAVAGSSTGVQALNLGQTLIANIPEQFILPTQFFSVQGSAVGTLELTLSSVFVQT